ncbi:MAG: protein tyrosine phosphatase [Phreatobacter sp.]|uniref:tyrosine phosphatase family protein n=1 Tax=Phreatobacter sp. TaxID=1966341 RepID=UPI001A59D4F6|nr:protein tyrosine phosphatase [Phreatobacter sp.]MBL8568844.1 protein tyrosine phosphatase [Phreatobacter sp.]
MEVHVCSLSRLASTVEATGARHVVTLINQNTVVPRPVSVAEADHLFLGMNDIVAPMDGYVAPGAAHVEKLLGFVDGWWRDHGRESPIVIHCWAGISRSTAAAFITACMVNPGDDEALIASELRRLSPSATPNIRLVALADDMLRRDGRMVAAIEAIGRGRDAFEGDPFSLRLAR